MSQAVTMTHEGGGFILTCPACQWTRFHAARSEAESSRIAHAAKCKGPKAEKVAALPHAPRSVKWDDREGATWIDQL